MSGVTRAAAKQNANSGARPEGAYNPIGTKEDALLVLKASKIVTKQSDISTVAAFSAALLRHSEKLRTSGQQHLQSSATDVKIYEAIAFLVVHLSNPASEAVKEIVLEAVADAATELGSKVGDELMRIRGEVETTNRAVEAIAKEVHAKVTKIQTPSAASYSAVVANGGQTRTIDPRAQARNAIRYRQVRLKASPTNANIGRDKDNRELRRVIQTALEDIGAPADVKLDSVKRFPDTEEILVEMDSEGAVDWLRTSDRLGLLAAKLGTTPVARRYKTIGKFFPTSFDPKRHLDELLEVNNIEAKHIESIDWFKDPARRSKGQLRAHVLIVFNDPKAANRAIARNIDIGHETCKVEKVKSEPMICRKCQRYNHLARDCSSEREVCGHCASDKHSTRDCGHRGDPRCVSCNKDGHPSYSRDCPTFLRRCEDHDSRNPDNALPFFPTDEPWTRIPRVERAAGQAVRTGPNSIEIQTRQPNQVERKKEARRSGTVRFSSHDEYEPTPQYNDEESETEDTSKEEKMREQERQSELRKAAEELEQQQREAQEEMNRLEDVKRALEEKRKAVEEERDRSRSRSPTENGRQNDQGTSRRATLSNHTRSPQVPAWGEPKNTGKIILERGPSIQRTEGKKGMVIVPMNEDNTTAPKARADHLRILQINLNKSPKAHWELLNDRIQSNWDIVLIQEPHRNYYRNVATAKGYRQVYPNDKIRKTSQVRSGIWVNERLSTNSWQILDIGDTADITAIQVHGKFGTISIFNVYNDCDNHQSTQILQKYIRKHQRRLIGDRKYMLWAGDFNRHHPMWDHDDDDRLFTNKALRDAQPIIDMIAEWNMEMALPKGIRTLQHMVSKRESRPDNVFISSACADRLVRCRTTEERPVASDHYYIETVIDIDKVRARRTKTKDFRKVEWNDFRDELERAMKHQNPAEPIATEGEFERRVDELTIALQDTIAAVVPDLMGSPYARRWWNDDLAAMRHKKSSLSKEARRNRAIPDHPVHKELKDHLRTYGDAIEKAKTSHWDDFISNAEPEVLWTIGGYVKNPAGDGGRPRMPSLTQVRDGTASTADSNEEKAALLATTFFPERPKGATTDEDTQYKPPHAASIPITEEMVSRHIARAAPHKAPGLDGIPNIVLQRSTTLIAPHLTTIFNAALTLGVYHQRWKDSITCVLRKPGKPSYEVPKAYRPIALLSTIGKLFSAILAEDISWILETYGELPNTHFGGRPGRTTTDALHYLVHKISKAWQRKKVVSVLYLDVEGAFPNAVTEKVIHNLRKRRIPEQYAAVIQNMLTGRRTRLRFDDYLSKFTSVNNGIGQGCPLSMIIYIVYNADLLEVTKGRAGEDAIGYVDDAIYIATGNSFQDTTNTLHDIMTRQGGGCEWSDTHNSKFEMSKVALMHFSRKTTTVGDTGNGATKARAKLSTTAPPLTIRGTTIEVVDEYKYLGVIMDPELRWTKQALRAYKKGLDWTLLFRRLSRVNSGMRTQLMRQLYLAVGIPRMTYASDVWYKPPRVAKGGKKRTGSVKALKLMERVQRMATIAITGAMRSAAGDTLDVHADTTPIGIYLEAARERSWIRLCTLTLAHPLGIHLDEASNNRDHLRKKSTVHHSPIQQMTLELQHERDATEDIGVLKYAPNFTPSHQINIDDSRERSMAREAADTNPIKIYSDGSAIDEQVGAAAILFDDDNEGTPGRTLQYFLGLKLWHCSYQAEWMGAVLAAKLLTDHLADKPEGAKVSIYIDNQSVVRTSISPKPGTTQHLQALFHDQMQELARTKKPQVTINWISAHTDVEMNEHVDEAAKEAATGRHRTARSELEGLVKIYIPVNKAALVQRAKEEAKAKWKEKWITSVRKKKLERFDESFPCRTYREATRMMEKSKAARLAQIRTGHFPLNDYLHKRALTENDKCKRCTAGKTENLTHFLFECPAYRNQRREMDRKLGRDKRNLKKIMASGKGIEALASYIAASGRFRKLGRETQQDEAQARS